MNNYCKKSSEEDTKQVSSSVLRKCCACGKVSDRTDFVRIMSEHNSGKIIINPASTQFGRSTYICKNSDCLKLAIKKKRLKNLSEENIRILAELCN